MRSSCLYTLGISVPRGISLRTGNSYLPSPRQLSSALISNEDHPDNDFTLLLMQWGQFLDHDITLTPETEAEECCEHADGDENCFPIQLPSVDPFYASRSSGAVHCLEFTRSTAFCEEEEERQDHAREQINGI